MVIATQMPTKRQQMYIEYMVGHSISCCSMIKQAHRNRTVTAAYRGTSFCSHVLLRKTMTDVHCSNNSFQQDRNLNRNYQSA